MIEFGSYYIGDVFPIGFRVKGEVILKEVAVSLKGPGELFILKSEKCVVEGNRVVFMLTPQLTPTPGKYSVLFRSKFSDGSERSVPGRFQIVKSEEILEGEEESLNFWERLEKGEPLTSRRRK